MVWAEEGCCSWEEVSLPPHLDVADDFEDGGAADNENKEANKPGSGWVLVLLGSEGLGHVSAGVDVLVKLAVRHPHPLLGRHLESLLLSPLIHPRTFTLGLCLGGV